MSYQALYRTYRPRRFEDVVGQEHITTILKNQIHTGHCAHAYLFCGSRGTGKTSTAKIFSRAINCLAPVEGEACGVCEACLKMEADDVDIIEIDAASNNGVDDMRALIEQARFTPLSLKYKVYIIDEVHMLSNSASNALLKTLEEPPAHVLFLLATTEPQKLLATVISRCQRYDFKRLALHDIVETLRSVLAGAGATMEEEGLYAVARAADGGMRDALSLLDQCLAFCGNEIKAQDVYDVLSCMDSDFLFDMADALIGSDAARALKLLDNLVRAGRNLGVFVQDLAQHLRALLLVGACGDCADLLECTQDMLQRYQVQASKCAQERLLRALQILFKTQSDMKWLGQPRVLVETALVRICRPEDEMSLLSLEDRLARLEQAFDTGMSWQAEEKGAKEKREEQPPLKMSGTNGGQAGVEKKEKPKGQMDKSAQASVETPAEQGATGDALWNALKKALQKQNASLYVLAMSAQSFVCEGNTLTVSFPASKEAAATALRMSRNYDVLKSTLQAIAPDKQLSIQVAADQAEDEETIELKRIFGNKLTVE